MTIKTLVCGDPHTEANENLRRFLALSNFTIDHQPDNIIFMGDYLSLDSLSSYDIGKPGKVENRRLKAELETGRRGIELFESGIQKIRGSQKRNKKRLYTPRKIFLYGNHEQRFNIYLDYHPELKGVLELDKVLGLKKSGWETYPYRNYTYIMGVGFTHIPMNGLNKPISGERMHINAAKDHAQPVVYGHTHDLVMTSVARHGEKDERISALNCGCFFEGIPEYAQGSKGSKNWWRGVIMLDHLNDKGDFDISTFSLEKMLEDYL